LKVFDNEGEKELDRFLYAIFWKILTDIKNFNQLQISNALIGLTNFGFRREDFARVLNTYAKDLKLGENPLAEFMKVLLNRIKTIMNNTDDALNDAYIITTNITNAVVTLFLYDGNCKATGVEKELFTEVFNKLINEFLIQKGTLKPPSSSFLSHYHPFLWEYLHKNQLHVPKYSLLFSPPSSSFSSGRNIIYTSDKENNRRAMIQNIFFLRHVVGLDLKGFDDANFFSGSMIYDRDVGTFELGEKIYNILSYNSSNNDGLSDMFLTGYVVSCEDDKMTASYPFDMVFLVKVDKRKYLTFVTFEGRSNFEDVEKGDEKNNKAIKKDKINELIIREINNLRSESISKFSSSSSTGGEQLKLQGISEDWDKAVYITIGLEEFLRYQIKKCNEIKIEVKSDEFNKEIVFKLLTEKILEKEKKNNNEFNSNNILKTSSKSVSS
jgi:hypothetical protein